MWSEFRKSFWFVLYLINSVCALISLIDVMLAPTTGKYFSLVGNCLMVALCFMAWQLEKIIGGDE